VVDAHLLALERAPVLGFGRYVISATTPFTPDDLADLPTRAADVVARRVPGYADVFAVEGWTMLDGIDRVYVNDLARRDLGWSPRHTFAYAIDRVSRGEPFSSTLARTVGKKNYHRAA